VGVYVYEYTTSWVERPPHSSYQRFTVSGSSAYRIDLSDDGDTLAVSYPGGTAAFTEEVAVFRWNATTYDLDYSQGSSATIGLGASMSLNSSGTRLALGYPFRDLDDSSFNLEPVGPLFYSGPYYYYGYNRTPNYYEYANYYGYGSYYGYQDQGPFFTRFLDYFIQVPGFILTTGNFLKQDNFITWELPLGPTWKLQFDYLVRPWSGTLGSNMQVQYYGTHYRTHLKSSLMNHDGGYNTYDFKNNAHIAGDQWPAVGVSEYAYFFRDTMLRIEIEYDNGVMTSSIRERDGSQRHVSNLTYDFGNSHAHLYGTSTYLSIKGVCQQNYSSDQFVTNVYLRGGANVGEIEVFDRSGAGSWSQVGGDITGGTDNQKLGTVVKMSGDGSVFLNVNEKNNVSNQKASIFTLNSGTWTRNASLLDTILSRTTVSGDTEDLVDLNDDGSFIVYAGTRTVTAGDNPNLRYLDGFELDGGVYKNVFTTPLPLASINHVSLTGDASRALVHTGQETSVFDVTETVFDPIITLTQEDDTDTLAVVGTYTEQGATSNVTDGSSVTVGGDTVTVAAGTYRVTYSVTDSNTGRSGFRTRVVIISET